MVFALLYVMQTKLTLRIDSELIESAKNVAKERDISLSRMVSDYFGALTQDTPSKEIVDLPPTTKSLHGILKGASVRDAKEEYQRFLEEKHT